MTPLLVLLLLLLVVVLVEDDDTDEIVEGSSQPESLDDEVLLADSWPDLDELISSIVEEVSDTVSPSPSFNSWRISSSVLSGVSFTTNSSHL